jgi:AcrR family transcriptional regulator
MKDNSKQCNRQKAKILDNARMLFWENGYDRTSMKDIARACGFEPGNIYNYFNNKETLLYEVMKEDMDKLISSVKHLERDNILLPTEQLRSYFENTARCILGPRRTSKLLTDVGLRDLTPAHRLKIIKLRDDYEMVLREVIRRGKESGDFADVDEALACYFIVSMIIRARIWFSPRGRLTSDKVANLLFDFALHGLRGDRKN